MSIPIRIRKIIAVLTVITMLVSLAIFMPATRVYASTVWTVNDASDAAGSEANVTLRYAMNHALSGDIISFADSVIGQCYYTTDGTDPRSSSTRIASNGLIPVSQSGTIRAANHTSTGWSDVATATFDIGGADSPWEPIIFPFEGNYSSAQTVYIYSPGADWLYYTTDGTDPGSSSTRTSFQGSFTSVTVTQTQTIRAIANYGSAGTSNIAEAHLSIGSPGPLTAPVITPNGGSFSGPLLVDICNKAGTIYLESPLPNINHDLTINGPGPESLAISGNYQTRVFEVVGGNVSISGLTVENGWVRGNTGFDGENGIAGGGGGGGGAAGGGGGMLVKGGTITIDSVHFYNNQAIGGSGGNGGAGFTGSDDYGDGGNGAVSDLIAGSTGGHGGIAPFAAVDFGIFNLSEARPGDDATDGIKYGGGGGGSGLNSNNEPVTYSYGGWGGQDVNGTIGSGPNGGSFSTNGSKGGNGGTGGYAHIEAYNNSYYGGNGGNGGDAYGGAICLINGAVQIQNSEFMSNTVLGGTGGAGGISYQGFSNGQTLDSFIFSIGSTMLSGNRGEFSSWWKLVDFGLSRVGNAFAYEVKSSTAYPYGGYPGNGGNAEGGGIYVSPYNASFGWNGAPLVLVNCKFSDNGAFGGYPGPETNWTGASGGFGQEFGSDIANKTNASYVALRNVTGANSNLGDVRTLSQTSATWSKVDASNLKATCGIDAITITVSLHDANNLPVWGNKVVLNQGSGHSQISPAYAITDNDGNATFTVRGTKAETIEYTVTDTSSNLTLSGKPLLLWDGTKDVPWTSSKVIFSAGPPNAGQSTVSSSHSTVTADGVSNATISVNIADAGGNILSGKQVTLKQGTGRSTVMPATATTDDNGNATFTVTNVYDESVTYTASVDNLDISQTATVNFSQYVWVVDNEGDGPYLGTLRYAIANAPSGTTIVFQGLIDPIELSSPLPPINKDLIIDGSNTGVTIDGRSWYRIFEINGGTVAIKGITLMNGKAKGNDGAYGGVSSQYGYGFGGGAGLSGVGGAFLITNGTVSIDGVSFINNQAVGGNGGNGGNATGYGWTGGGGGTAGDAGIGQGGAIYLTDGSLTISNSTFTGSNAVGGSGGTGGNGSCYGGEGGKGADGNGGAIFVKAGSLTVTNSQFTNSRATGGNGGNGGGGGNTTAGEHGNAGGNGWGGAIYANTGTLTLAGCQFSEGSVAGGSLGTGNHGSIGSAGTAVAKDIYIKNCVTSMSQVTFSTGTNSYINLTPADAGQSVVTASPTSVFSNGSSASTIKVALKCSNGHPAVGKTVILIPGSGSSAITTMNNGITDSNGEVTFTVSDAVGETVTYTAKDTTDVITVAMTASVTFLPPDAGQSTVSVDRASLLADGNEASTITVTLKYSDGSPSIGKTVTLIPDDGSSSITPVNNGITDNNGIATFIVTDSQPETVVYTAKDTTDNATVTQTATVTFTPYDWKVSTLNEGSGLGTLRYAIQNAPPGTTITFRSGLAGTIVLNGPLPIINKDLTIDGSGANVTISGNNQFRVFEVASGNVIIKDLIIADGKATGNAGADMTYNWYDVIGVGNNGGNGAAGSGGGLLIRNGTVTLEGVTFMDNKAIGGKGGLGGNGPQVNTGGVGGTGGDGNGGAICLDAGALTIVDSSFTGNYSAGGAGGDGGNAHVNGGNGGTGGNGNGGAIFVNSGSLMITSSQLSSNSVYGGSGGIGGQSGTVWGGSANGSTGGFGSAIGHNLYNRNGTVVASDVTIDTENNSYHNLPSINAITYDCQGGSSISSKMYTASIVINAPVDPIRPGYFFGGWYKEPDCINAWNFSTDKVIGEITLYAKWTALYSVTFFAVFSSNPPPVMDNVLSGSKINPPTDPTRIGLSFGGWYKEPDLINAWDFSTDTVTQNITLYAKWINLPQYQVRFNPMDGSQQYRVFFVFSGYTVDEPDVLTRVGYTLEGWYKESECINKWDFNTDTVHDHMELYAKWTALPTYTLTFDATGGSPALSTDSIYSGYTVGQPAAPTQAGYIFGGWYKEPACTNAWDFSTDTVTGDITLYAKWTALYSVTFDPNNSSQTTVLNNVVSGSSVDEPAAPSWTGYTFAGWYKESACTNEWDFNTDTVYDNITLYAKWSALPTYTVTFNAQGGSPALSTETVYLGYTVNEPAEPEKSGYYFGGWYKDKEGINAWNFSTDVVTGDAILYANWSALPTYTVNFEAQGGSSVSSTNNVISGFTISAPSVPVQAGYTFGGWYKEPACNNEWDFNTDTVNDNITLYAKWTALPTYTVTFKDWDNTVLKTETVIEGSNATPPANPHRASHAFTGWDSDFSNVTSDLTVTALYSYSGGGGNTSNDITGTEAPKPVIPNTQTSVSGNNVTSTTTSTAATDSKGNATTGVTREQISDAVVKAVAEAAKQGESAVANVEIRVNIPGNPKSIEISIPKPAVNEIGGSNIASLEVSTPLASMSFDQNALNSISQAASGDVKILAAAFDTSLLPETTRQTVGDRPVFEFSVRSGNNTISQFDGRVKVTVPYTPKAGEDPNAIVIFYINAEGNLEIVSDCDYDPVTGNITFETNHFSQYAIGYNKVSFADVKAEAWYSSAVDFIAARSITMGTGNGNFGPDAKLTRGEFIVMMMKAYGITPDTQPKENFADAGDNHYTGYLAAAKRLGISGGVGSNMFAPEREITRQEMFTLMYNVLKVIDALPSGTSGSQLSSFVDADLISSWAMDAMKVLVETGSISGNGGRLSPTSTSTRAQLAQVLYILLSK